MEVMHIVYVAGSDALKISCTTHQEVKASATLLENNRPQEFLLKNLLGVLDGGWINCASYV